MSRCCPPRSGLRLACRAALPIPNDWPNHGANLARATTGGNKAQLSTRLLRPRDQRLQALHGLAECRGLQGLQPRLRAWIGRDTCERHAANPNLLGCKQQGPHAETHCPKYQLGKVARLRPSEQNSARLLRLDALHGCLHLLDGGGQPTELVVEELEPVGLQPADLAKVAAEALECCLRAAFILGEKGRKGGGKGVRPGQATLHIYRHEARTALAKGRAACCWRMGLVICDRTSKTPTGKRRLKNLPLDAGPWHACVLPAAQMTTWEHAPHHQ